MISSEKSLAQKVRQKSDILDHLQHGCWVPVRPVRGHLTLKMNITFFFYQELDTEYLFIRQLFEKSRIFQENCEKLFWGKLDNFLGKGGILSQKLT